MYKKLFVILCLVMTLAGCSVTKTDVTDEVFEVLKTIESNKINEEVNNRRSYYDYFLPRNVGQRANTDLDIENAEFLLNGTSFYMSLDIAEVIINEYYDPLLKYKNNYYTDILHVGEILINRNGEITDYKDLKRKYRVIVTQLDETDYFLYVSYGDVYFVTMCKLSEISDMVYNMLTIGRSVRVDSELVLANYSNKVTTVIEESYDLFEKVFPESGVVADVLNDGNDTVGGDDLHQDSEEIEDGEVEEDSTEEDKQ